VDVAMAERARLAAHIECLSARRQEEASTAQTEELGPERMQIGVLFA
jgi:hypothetical protein